MKPGPPPKPTRLKVIEGNRGKKRLNDREPQPALLPAVPDPPDFLPDEAKAEWNRRAPELFRIGVLTSVDVSALAAYCQAYARWRQAEAALARMGAADMLTGALMIRTQTGNPIQNPILATANRAIEQMIRLAAEFGMTPASRSRIATSGTGGETDDPLARLMSLHDGGKAIG